MIFLFLIALPWRAGSDFQWPFPERNEFPFHPNVLGNWINSRCLWIQEPRKILSIWPAHEIKVIWQNTLLILIFPIYLSIYLSYILYLFIHLYHLSTYLSISSIYLFTYLFCIPSSEALGWWSELICYSCKYILEYIVVGIAGISKLTICQNQ